MLKNNLMNGSLAPKFSRGTLLTETTYVYEIEKKINKVNKKNMIYKKYINIDTLIVTMPGASLILCFKTFPILYESLSYDRSRSRGQQRAGEVGGPEVGGALKILFSK